MGRYVIQIPIKLSFKAKDVPGLAWLTKDYPTRLKNMEHDHIKSTMYLLERCKTQKFGQYTGQEWLVAFEIELRRRELAANTILKKFPKAWKDYKRVVTKKTKSYTTRGIKVR